MKKTKELTPVDFNKEILFKTIIIVVENLTDEKINNIDVINFDYKERDDLRYSSDCVSYSLVLRHISAKKVSLMALSKYYEKANEEQENAKIKLMYFDAFARGIDISFSDCVLFQEHKLENEAKNMKIIEHIKERYSENNSNKKKQFEFGKSPLVILEPLTTIRLEYLMPKTKATFTLFCK